VKSKYVFSEDLGALKLVCNTSFRLWPFPLYYI